jgi:transcriptional antiterminator RfaH
MTMDWYVVQTHTNSEAKAAEHLRRQGYEVYLPQMRRWRSHARRRELVARPLFPRYLFVNFDPEHARWRSILSTLGVASMICHGEKPSHVPEGVVEEIRQAERGGWFDDVGRVSRLKIGDTVRIACGPFADLVGQLQSLTSDDRVRVLLDILGRRVMTIVKLKEVAPA